MGVIFKKKNKKQKYYLILFFVIIAVIIFLAWKEFFTEETLRIEEHSEVPAVRKEVVDFDVLENAKDMEYFERIKPLPDEEAKGRENPFTSY